MVQLRAKRRVCSHDPDIIAYPFLNSPIMKLRIHLMLFLVGAILAGCSTSSDQLNNIRIGMTVDQVTSILGKPDSTSAQANVVYLTYYLDAPNLSGREQPYMVRLVDGKVESFGRFRQLFDLYTRPITNAQPGDPNFPQAYGMGMTTTIPLQRSDLVSQLSRLKALKDQGALTDAEFQKAKDQLLSPQK
jgi:putative oligomerization/nucleic acid binding protein